MLILKEKHQEIVLKARGKHIAKAIRVSDAAVKKAGVSIANVKIGIDKKDSITTPYIEIILRK